MRGAIFCAIFLICGLADKCSKVMQQEPAVGQKLQVISAPEGATVKLDGTEKGKTPLVITDLQVKSGESQVVTFNLDGYKTVSKKITWNQAEQVVTATMEKATAERVITVKSSPAGADVYVDGVPKGETPVTFSLELEDGASVSILAQRKGYADQTEKLTFTDETKKDLEFKFFKEGKLSYADLDKVLLKMEKKWRTACKTNPDDVCFFTYNVNSSGKVTAVPTINCKYPDINNCTKKMVRKMKFPAAESGRSDKFTWYGR
jgi:uncharacterized cupredoxin-like copper-binding protein